LKAFQEKCYFVTHRIFTNTSWCTIKPKLTSYDIERRFLMYYLPYLQEAQDIELVGEFVQTLKCLGHSENEIIIQRAIEYLLSCRHESVRDLRSLTCFSASE